MNGMLMSMQTLQWARNNYRLLLVASIFVICFGLRVLHVAEFSKTPYFFFTYDVVNGPDQNTFYEWANAISEGRWTFRKLEANLPFYTAPLYSIVMAAAFRLSLEIPQFLIFQALLSSLLVFVFYGISKIMRSESIGILAGLIWCFYGVSAYYDSCLIRASSIASLTLIVFWSYISSDKKPSALRWLRTGILLGILISIRGSILFILLPFWILFGKGLKHSRQRILPALLVIIASFAFISPFTIRNYRESGKFVPVASQGADAIWLGNSSDTLGVSFFPSKQSAELLKESQNSIRKSIPILFREIKNDPEGYARLYLRKIKMLFNDYEIPANYSYYVFKRLLPISNVTFLTFIWILPLASLGIFFAYKNPYFKDLMFFVLALSFSALFIHIQSRYRFPLMPFLIILASFGLKGIILCIKDKQWIKITASILLITIVVIYQKPLPSYGVLHRTGSDGIRVLNESKIRDVDYITLIMSYLFDRSTNRQEEINKLSEEGGKLYGKEFLIKFNDAVAKLKP